MSDHEDDSTKTKSDHVGLQPIQQASTISVKIPPFMESSVSNWFLIIEAQFKISRITSSDTKFYYVIANLPTTVLDKLDQKILESTKFEDLKAEIISRFEQSKPELFRKILATKTLTGKPSNLMAELQTIAKKVGVGDDLVKHQFLEAVPSSVSSVLVCQDDLTLSQMAKLADSMQAYVQPSQAFQVSRSREHSPRRESRTPIGLRPYSQNQKPKICRAHIYFLEKARTCKPWCRFPGKNPNIPILPNSRRNSPSNSRNSSPERRPEN